MVAPWAGRAVFWLVYRRTRAMLLCSATLVQVPATHSAPLKLSEDASVAVDTPFVAAASKVHETLVLFEDSNLAKRKLSHR